MVRAPEWLLVIDQLGIRVISPSLAALVCSHSCHLSLQTLNLRFHLFQAWESSLDESSESERSSAVAFCDPRFCLEGLERHAQLAWMLYPWLIKLWGGVCYIIGASLPAPEGPGTCHVMYYIISQILIAHLTIFFDHCRKHRNYILKLFHFWGFLANFMATS